MTGGASPGVGTALWRRRVVAAATAALFFALSWVLRAAFADQPSAPMLPAVLWAACILLSLVGWGALVNRLLAPGQRLDWGQRAAWGVAAVIVLGGVLNLLGAISPLTVFALLSVGAASWCFAVFARDGRRSEGILARLRRVADDPMLAVLVLVAAAGVLLQLGASATGTIDTVFERPAFDLHDDEQAYLVFPEKMLQTGSMGAEPFEARRMLSLGGQSFLLTLVRATLPVRSLHLMDMGVAFVILVGLIIGYGRRHRLDSRATVFAVILLLVLPHLGMRGNTSALLTGVVLMVSWFRLLADDVLEDLRSANAGALTALTASGLVALKSTFIPAAAVLFLAPLLCSLMGRDRRRALHESAIAGGLVAVFSLPWMVSILASSGTLLYPVFGKGMYGGVYTDDFAHIAGDFGLSPWTRLRALFHHMTALLPTLVLAVFIRDRCRRRPGLAMAAAAVVSVMMLVVMGDAEINRAMARYAFPVITAAVLSLLLTAFKDGADRVAATAAAVVVGAFFVLGDPGGVRRTYDQLVVNLAAAVEGEPVVDARQAARSTLMQASVPAGASLLATVPRPYLMDFRRNPVLVMSLPGMSSPPPGMPIFSGAEAVAEYLQAHSIRHLAYGGVGDYRALLKLEEAQILERYPHSKMRWVMLRYHQRYKAVVESLRHTRKRLFEDDELVVLDLGRRVHTTVPSQEPHRAIGFKDGVWAGAEAEILDLTIPGDGGVLALRTMGWRPAVEAPRLVLGGEDLMLEEEGDGLFLYRLRPGPPARTDLVIESSPLDPLTVGASLAADGLGIDVQSIEIAADVQEIGPATGRSYQAVAGELRPEAVWKRSGFYDDFNWTNGDARLDGLDWPVPEDRCSLVLRLYGVHPRSSDPGALDVRVAVNGVELALDRIDGLDHVFRLYDNLEIIQTVLILSQTFVPAASGSSTDKRILGVPIEKMVLRTDS